MTEKTPDGLIDFARQLAGATLQPWQEEILRSALSDKIRMTPRRPRVPPPNDDSLMDAWLSYIMDAK